MDYEPGLWRLWLGVPGKSPLNCAGRARGWRAYSLRLFLKTHSEWRPISTKSGTWVRSANC